MELFKKLIDRTENDRPESVEVLIVEQPGLGYPASDAIFSQPLPLDNPTTVGKSNDSSLRILARRKFVFTPDRVDLVARQLLHSALTSDWFPNSLEDLIVLSPPDPAGNWKESDRAEYVAALKSLAVDWPCLDERLAKSSQRIIQANWDYYREIFAKVSDFGEYSQPPKLPW